MGYLEKMSGSELAEQYATFHNQEALLELKKRDWLLAPMESDKQLLLDFSEEAANTSSVKDSLEQAYEAGFQAGKKVGEKVGRKAEWQS